MHSLKLNLLRGRRFFGLLPLRLAPFVVALFAVALQATAAYGADAAEGEGGKSYGIPWLIIVLVVALGVFITLRPAGRESEIKRDLRADL